MQKEVMDKTYVWPLEESELLEISDELQEGLQSSEKTTNGFTIAVENHTVFRFAVDGMHIRKQKSTPKID
jgi:hypothetical protein